jgi:hypothetical protein
MGVLAVAMWLLSASTAAAGTYDVYGCRLPDGRGVPADGWAPYTAISGGSASIGCGPGGGLTAWLDPSAAVYNLAQAGWVFESPPDTTIEEYTLYRTSVVERAAGEERGRGAWLYHDAPTWEGASPSRYAQTACIASFGCSGQGDASTPLAAENLYQKSNLRILRLF